jgi:hypothetical protein
MSSMADKTDLFFTIGVLAAIALGATVVAFALETYYGPSALFAALGQGLAVLGALIFALWLLKRTKWSPLNESTAPGGLSDVSSTLSDPA